MHTPLSALAILFKVNIPFELLLQYSVLSHFDSHAKIMLCYYNIPNSIVKQNGKPQNRNDQQLN